MNLPKPELILQALHSALDTMCSTAMQHLEAAASHQRHNGFGSGMGMQPAVWTGPTAARHRVKLLSSGASAQPDLVFTLHGQAVQPSHTQKAARRVVRMPLPWASISGAPELPPTQASGTGVPRLFPPKAKASALQQEPTQTKDKEEPQERILISEVGGVIQ